MKAPPRSHRERFIDAVQACIPLIEDDEQRNDLATRLDGMRRSPGGAEAEEELVRKLAVGVKSLPTIDCVETQRMYAIFVRNGNTWP